MSANDNGNSPVYYRTLGSAEHHCQRMARETSPTRTVKTIPYLDHSWQAREGGPVFVAELAAERDYSAREMPAAEVTRRVQSAMRYAVAEHYERAAAHDVAASLTRMGSVRNMHLGCADGERKLAREIETRLTINTVRAVSSQPQVTEPFARESV
jgi:hypothetical protein